MVLVQYRCVIKRKIKAFNGFSFLAMFFSLITMSCTQSFEETDNAFKIEQDNSIVTVDTTYWENQCESCHQSENLSEDGSIRYWGSRSLESLSQYITSAMPYTNPGLCEGDCAIETARYLQAVLSGNTIVSGSEDQKPNDSIQTDIDVVVPTSFTSQCVSCHALDKIETEFAAWAMQNTGELSAYIEMTMPFANATACIDNCAEENATFIMAVLDAANEPTNPNNGGNLPVILAKPTNLVALAKDGSITLSWTDNASNESAFNIWRKLGDSSWAVFQNVAANTTEYVDQNVPAQIIQYRVEAINAAGDSEISSAVSVDLSPIQGGETCNEPEYVAGTTYSSGQNVQVKGQLYECKQSVSAWCSSSAAWAYAPDKGLYWTEAWTAKGACTSGGSTEPQVVLNTPTLLSAVVVENSVSLTWLDNSEGETAYVVERSVNASSFVTIATLAANAETYIDQDEQAGSVVKYRVFAKSGDLLSNKLVTQNIDIPATSFSAAEFYASDCAACHGARGEGSSNGSVSISGFNAKSWTLATLTDSIDKTMPFGNTTKCIGDCASSVANYILNEFVASSTLPNSASNVFVGANSDKTIINLSWSDNADNETGFRIERSVNNGAFVLVKNVGKNETTFMDTDVQIGMSYRYRITAFNDTDVSTAVTSSALLLEVIITVPQKPTNLLVAWTANVAELSWVDNANNETSFVLQRRKNKGSWSADIVLAENQTSYTDSDITIGDIYDYRLLATNSAGDSFWSDEITLDLTNAQNRAEFEANCAGCHKPGGIAVDLFNGFTEQSWQTKSWDQFIAKVNSMPTSSCDANCKEMAATYVWSEKWGLTLDSSVASHGRGVRGIRLMTSYEYMNTVKDIFGFDLPKERLPADRQASDFKFAADAHAGVVIYDRLNEFLLLAEYIAENAQPSGYGCGVTCSNTQIKTLLDVAFRQSVDNDMLNEYSAMQSNYGRNDMIASILLSPFFLYRVELGEWNTTAQAYQLNDYEVATALSYQLWGTAPSKQLLAKASQGLLSTPAQIEAEATTMINDAKAARHLVEFVKYYTNTQSDLAEKPNLSSAVINAMEQERNAAVTYALTQGQSTLNELFNPDYTFLNQTLANQYGISGVTATTMTKVPVDRNRGGLLLQGVLHVHNSDFTATSLVKRGKMIRENMMCHAMGVPSGVDPSAIQLPTEAISTRQRWDVITGPDASEGQCWSCHQLMNEPGSVLESYDAAGRFRTEEVAYNNSAIKVAIETAGLLRSNDTTEVLVDYQDARGLSEYLANSPVGQDCFVDNYFRFSTGYSVDADVKPDVAQWSQKFRVGGEIWPLVKQSVTSESFLYRTDRN